MGAEHAPLEDGSVATSSAREGAQAGDWEHGLAWQLDMCWACSSDA